MLSSSIHVLMPIPTQLASTAFSIATIFTWGTSDFVGGYAAKRADAFLLTAVAHASGFILMLSLALTQHAPIPNTPMLMWAAAAGLSGGAALAIFYRALAAGNMGLTAPVAALLGAAIPAALGMLTEGWPRPVQAVGFVLAAAGIWLISRHEATSDRPKGLANAVLAGLGFAGFFLFIRQTGDSSVLWSASASRLASFVFVLGVVLFRRGMTSTDRGSIDRRGIVLGIVAGCLHTAGTALFVRSSQTGRLDAAVVLGSLYPALTVLLAWLLLEEHFSRWRALGMIAALVAVPLIAM